VTPDFGLPERWTEALCRWATQKPEVREIWVFGSRARADHRPDSDIDIALKIHGDTPADKDCIYICEAQGWRAEIQGFTPVPVHLDHGDEDCESHIVVPALAREGRRLYP